MKNKKFTFKLKAILKLRKLKEDEIKIELGNTLKEINKVNLNMDEINQQVEEIYKSQTQLASSDISGQMLKFYPNFLQAKREEYKNKENILKALYRKKNDLIKKLAEAKGKTEIMTKLKAKEEKSFKKEKLKQDQLNIEELLQYKRIKT